MANDLKILIGSEEAEVESISDFPISINYKLENVENFQQKSSDNAFDISLPATLQNQKIANSFHDPSVEDNTPEQIYKNHRPVKVIADGTQLLDGKAFLINASHDKLPKDYNYSFYGGNANWIIELKNVTLFDVLKHLTFTLTKAEMEASWLFDGRDELKPYVFAPVRYRGTTDINNANDKNFSPTYLRPAISPYWAIHFALKSLGYKLKSNFMDSDYFRRLVMPWTWGNFLDSDGTKLQAHKFLAKSLLENYWIENYTGVPNLEVSNDSTDGAYDNNNDYTFTGGFSMLWEYKTPHFGNLDATFSVQVPFDCTLVGSNSYCRYSMRWYHTDAITNIETLIQGTYIINAFGVNLARKDFVGVAHLFFTHQVKNGDKIRCEPYIDIHEGSGVGARANCVTSILSFQLEYFRIPLGGTIDFQNYTGLKNYKILDLFAGIFDMFDFSICTDTGMKEVTMEPTHNYSLVNNLNPTSPGYFYGNTIDWTDKKELRSQWKLDLYADYERTLFFKYKDDSADGILKILQDRNTNTLFMAKYLFPPRFKAETREIVNRFFSASTHYENIQMKPVTGIAPQFMCIIPENVSNTSAIEAGNTFQPKIAYYKGLTTGVGGWTWDNVDQTALPFMFSVNYKDTTGNDPNLSYSDERVNGINVPGLMKRFFWQRLAIMRNGQYYNAAQFKLNNNDVLRTGHREYKIVDGIKYELIEISGYKPLKEEPTTCVMKKWVPVSQVDFDNSFPSATALIVPVVPISSNDIKYAQALCLTTDIPQ